LKQRVGSIGGLILQNIEPGSGDLPMCNRIDKCRLVDEHAASDVDKDGPALHRSKLSRIDQVLIFFAGSNADDYKIGMGDCGVQLIGRIGSNVGRGILRVFICCHDFHAKWAQSIDELLSDGSQANDARRSTYAGRFQAQWKLQAAMVQAPRILPMHCEVDELTCPALRWGVSFKTGARFLVCESSRFATLSRLYGLAV
jgi:hypothetical protein